MALSTLLTNTKVTHANLLHARWSSKYNKKVISTRTESLSSNSNTAKKQNIRFERSERRVFNQHKPCKGEDLNLSEKSRISRRCKFLFSGVPSLKIPIKHLQYKKAQDTPWQKDYNFLLPYDGLIPTVAPYNPKPKGFIPVKYRDIIPPDPIYSTNGSFIVPGSREWFTYMYNLEKRLRHEIISNKLAKEKKQSLIDHGSSAKHHDLRQEQKRHLTELTDFYHEGLTTYHNDLAYRTWKMYPSKRLWLCGQSILDNR
ncbi:hypothetical protein RhiirA4_430979 [Rhizophagus irregularis]|uniref:DUF8211 domain-containing protein n=1 Tax=Rhizophagus irregularis TaxID=588596 RepID=A0A2I1HMY2_9GLOM|nr:hypothetical protein RhiirA4_430979 [Rhizophagus irregularis]